MGEWGTGHFQNDIAADWVNGLIVAAGGKEDSEGVVPGTTNQEIVAATIREALAAGVADDFPNDDWAFFKANAAVGIVVEGLVQETGYAGIATVATATALQPLALQAVTSWLGVLDDLDWEGSWLYEDGDVYAVDLELAEETLQRSWV